jgi:hypothetical protein
LYVAAGRRIGHGECVFLGPRRGFTHPRPCTSAYWLPARGTRRWWFSRRGTFAPGRYIGLVKAVDFAGNEETPAHRGNRLSFHVR